MRDGSMDGGFVLEVGNAVHGGNSSEMGSDLLL